MQFRHAMRVRYAEVDMQRHVFNAHYLTYVDEAWDAWLRSELGEGYLDDGFDMVLKRADITWHSGAGFGDTLAIDMSVERWGNTSLAIGFDGSVGERPVFDAVVTYISVKPGTTEPTPVPDVVRAALNNGNGDSPE
jgi:acyl-CoA thioester hydrolase